MIKIKKEKNKTKLSVYLFMGRSGCGKGTQIELFKKKLKINNNKILCIESGPILKNFAKGNSYTQKLTKKIVEVGGLLPESIAICRWQQYLIKNFTGKENIIFDGISRKFLEAQILDKTLKFYNIQKYKVIHINTSSSWCTEKLLARNRKDDTKKGIEKRMKWYDTDVSQSINFFKNNKDCEFIDVNGEQTIEQVHNEIIKKVF
ncbi:MAG: nucleoside monophosphate kinase [bacterium]